MPRIIVASILAALLTVIACGGGSLHPEEYAEECGDLADELNDAFDIDVYYVDDLSDLFENLEYALEDFKALNPPEEFERLHELRVEGVELAIEGIKDTDFLKMSDELLDLLHEIEDEDLDYDEQQEMMEDFQDKWEDSIDEMEDRFEEYEEELSDIERDIREEEADLHPDDYDLLRDEGCI